MHQQKLNILKKMAELRGGSSASRVSSPNNNAPKNSEPPKSGGNPNGSRGCGACSRKKQS